MSHRSEEFHHILVHRDMVALLHENKVTPLEVLFAGLVDGLVKARGEGCWASNGYFAKLLHVSERHIKAMVAKLVKDGILIRCGFHMFHGRKQRLIETVWSRITREVQFTAPVNCTSLNLQDSSSLSEREHAPGQNPGEREEEKMPFWEDTPKATKDPPNQEDEKFTERLRQVVVKRLRNRKYNPKAWANEFRLLRHELNDDTTRVEKALTFYEAHAGKEYIPVIDSAASFRKKFLALEAARKRHAKDNPDLTISPLAKKIVGQIEHLKWPKGSLAKLEWAVQMSLNNFGAIYTGLEKFKDATESNRLKGVAKNALDYLSVPTVGFMQRWWREVFGNVSDWNEWSGDLKPFVLSLSSKRFTQMAREWTERWGKTAEDWDRVAESIKE